MFSRLFRRRKPEDEIYKELPVPEGANWSFLGADMHSHFIPGIDDGAKTMEDTLALLRAMKAMGYNTIITTPHVMIDFYPNTTQIIQDGLKKVQEAVKENNLDITVRAAAEYYIDEYFMQIIEKEPLLTIHNNELLVEFSMMFEPPMLMEAIFKIQQHGYKPIIAHPERYLFFHREFHRYYDLKEKGCLLQMNMLSITGYYGHNIKLVAEDLMQKGLYDYCGSDMHHEKHASTLKAITRNRDYFKISGYPFRNAQLCGNG